jgi:hypothetical protein
MVHVDNPVQLEATLAAVAAFNDTHPNIRLQTTKMVRLANGTKRTPAGLWLITENHDTGPETGLYWKTAFQWVGRSIAADPQSCHTIRRSRNVVWSFTSEGEQPSAEVFALDLPLLSSSSRKRPSSSSKKKTQRCNSDAVVGEGDDRINHRNRKRKRPPPKDSAEADNTNTNGQKKCNESVGIATPEEQPIALETAITNVSPSAVTVKTDNNLDRLPVAMCIPEESDSDEVKTTTSGSATEHIDRIPSPSLGSE